MLVADSPLHPARIREETFTSQREAQIRYAQGRNCSPWMVTATGRRVDLLDPKPEQIDIQDIAFHLAGINRFTGATRMSVAQHSVLVSRLCQRMPLAGLLHDAHEAYLGDISRPLADTLQVLGCGEALKLLKARFDMVIAFRFDLEPDALWTDDVKAADNTLLATEKRDLLTQPACGWDATREPLPAPLPITLRPECTWVFARNQFLARFHELTE